MMLQSRAPKGACLRAGLLSLAITAFVASGGVLLVSAEATPAHAGVLGQSTARATHNQRQDGHLAKPFIIGSNYLVSRDSSVQRTPVVAFDGTNYFAVWTADGPTPDCHTLAFVIVMNAGLLIYDYLDYGIIDEISTTPEGTEFAVLENPIRDKALRLRVNSRNVVKPHFALYDAEGKRVADYAVSRLTAGSHVLTLSLPTLPPGPYFLTTDRDLNPRRVKVVLMP